MAQIRIKTPITSDGIQLVLDASGRVTYREDYADARSKKDFERQNNKLPNNLKMIIEDVEVETPKEVEQQKIEEPVIEENFSKAIKKTTNKKTVEA